MSPQRMHILYDHFSRPSTPQPPWRGTCSRLCASFRAPVNDNATMFLKCGVCGLKTVWRRMSMRCASGLTQTELLVTSSHFSLDETQQGIINSNVFEPTQDSLDAPLLYISDRSNRTWMIPIAECSTWLVSHHPAVLVFSKLIG